MRSKRGFIMCDWSLYALALIFCTIAAFGQSQTVGPNGEGSFIAGPEGIPLRVLNEANSWSQPSAVFKNNKIEIFSHGITPALRLEIMRSVTVW